jgi:hypothetical protein
MPITTHLMMDHYNYLVNGLLLLEFQNNFIVLHLVHPNLQKTFQSNEK